jgi:ubiquinone/menaquinone biosynthesis C-methylase UbiE
MQTRKEYFASIAPQWNEWRVEEESDVARVMTESGLEPGQRVLDVGTGTGVLIPLLTRAVGSAGEILAIDNVPEMIDQVREKHIYPNVSSAVLDIHRTGLPSHHFDRVFANACYPHFEDKPTALLEIRRLLKPDGRFILSHPIGRDAVNALHRTAHPIVANDTLPPTKILAAQVEEFGFETLRIIDEPKFFLLAFKVESRTR